MNRLIIHRCVATVTIPGWKTCTLSFRVASTGCQCDAKWLRTAPYVLFLPISSEIYRKAIEDDLCWTVIPSKFCVTALICVCFPTWTRRKL